MSDSQKPNYDITKFEEPTYYADVESIELLYEHDLNKLHIGLYPIRGFSIQDPPEVMIKALPIKSVEQGQTYSEIRFSHPTEIIIHWSSHSGKLHIRGINHPKEQPLTILEHLRKLRKFYDE